MNRASTYDRRTRTAETQSSGALARFVAWVWRDVLAMVLFGLLTIGFFWQSIFLPNYHVPIGGGDLVSFLYPVYSFAARSLQQGAIPFWNPYLYSGSPFMADMQSGIFYPINLIAFVFSRPFTYTTLESMARLHYFVAAAFMYIYARGLNLSRPAAFGAGIAFAFSGFTIAHLGHLNMLEAAIWLPLILFFLHRSLTKHSFASAILAGAFYAISILPGHTQMTLIIGFLMALYWLWGIGRELLSLRGQANQAARPILLAPVLSLPIAFVIALGASAFQLLPVYELVSLSLRSEITYLKSIEYSTSPLGLISLFVPHFFGPSIADYWGIKWNNAEVFAYAGILPMLLAALALVLRRRWRLRWFLAGLALIFLLLAVGDQTILHGWLYKFVPGFDKVRAAGRFLFPFNFAIAALAGIGLDAMMRPLARRSRPAYRILLTALGVILAAFTLVAIPLFAYAYITSQNQDAAIFNRIGEALNSMNLTALLFGLGLLLLLLYRYLPSRRTIVVYLAIGLIVLDLFSTSATMNQGEGDLTTGYQHQPAIEFLKGDPDSLRIDAATGAADVWQPNLALLEEIDDVMGIYNPMMLADYDRYWGNLGSRSVPAYDLLNVKYVIGHKDVPLDWEKFKPVFTGDPTINIFQNSKALPRAMIVPNAETMSREDILARIKAPNFNPNEVVLLEKDAKISGRSSSQVESKITELRHPSPNEVVVKLSTNGPSFLLLNEVAYPGWRAFVDGRETEALRANYIFKAVALDNGDHEVRFVFQPRRWEVMVAVSVFTWLIVAGAIIFTIRQRLARKDQSIE